MTEAMTVQLPIVQPLQALGDPNAAACDGDFCEIPEHHTQAVVNRKLDDDAV